MFKAVRNVSFIYWSNKDGVDYPFPQMQCIFSHMSEVFPLFTRALQSQKVEWSCLNKESGPE